MIILAPAIGILIGLALLVVVDIHHGAPVKEAVGFVVEVFPMVLLTRSAGTDVGRFVVPVLADFRMGGLDE